MHLVREQTDRPQPGWLVLVSSIVVPTFLPTEVTRWLMRIDTFAAFCGTHPVTYMSSFFVIQVSAAAAFAVYYVSRYGNVLTDKRAHERLARNLLVSAACTLPMLAYYAYDGLVALWDFTAAIDAVAAASTNANELASVLSDARTTIWGRMAYGASDLGIVFTSIQTVVMPLCEECTITGILFNKIAHRFRYVLAAIVLPLAFALVHVPQFGFGPHLIPLVLCGTSYLTIRLLTGSVVYSILSHVAINIVVMAPKWGALLAIGTLGG